MKTTTNYLHAIALNNKGAELLEKGRIKEARLLLVKALNLTKLITIEKRKHPKQRCDLTLEYRWLDRIDMMAPPNTFIYQRPIQIVEKPELADCRALAADFTSAIVFNVSVAYHLEALTCSKLLKKALHGYEIALDLRKGKRRTRCALLDLAIINNIAHVHVEQSDFANANRFFVNLALLLRGQRKEDLDAIDVDGFTMGALWRHPSCAPVA